MEISNSTEHTLTNYLNASNIFNLLLLSLFIYFFDGIMNLMYILFTNIYKYYSLYKNFKNVTKMSCFSILSKCFKLCYNYATVRFFSWVNGNVIRKIDRNLYEVSFVIGSKVYKMFVNHSREPSDILQIIDENNEDVTEIYEPFFNYTYIQISPEQFGHDNIEIMYSDGESKEYKKNEKLD